MTESFQPKLVSVIVPSFNRESSIIESLDSVFEQTYRPIEIILVDDGSTDETRKIVEKWVSEKSKDNFSLRYFYQTNAGASAARNRGIKEITGQYVQFLDSDDRLHSQRFVRLVDVFEETGADFIQTGFDGFNAETGETIEQHFGNPDENQVGLALKGRLWANTLRSAFRRSLVDKIGPWDTEMTCFEDREYVERAVVQADKPIAIREILASARRGGSSRISDRLRSYEGRKWRIFCEQRLLEAIRSRDDVSYEAKQAFASRLYGLGLRSNASGWKDLGDRCMSLAESIEVKLDKLGRRRRLVCKMGKLAGKLYAHAHTLKARAS